MSKIWEHNSQYSFWRHYVDICTRTSFSSVSIEGLENIPRDSAVIFAPNHCAALMDPLLMLLVNHDEIGFGARSDIFKGKRVIAFLRWLRILPMARERNGLQEVAKNFETFTEIVDCLDHNVPFCLYSEGSHRAERGMMPVKKGIFKIAKMASDQLGKPVYILPAGVYYEDFFRQLRRVSIRIGKPFEIKEFFDANADETESTIYKKLCDKLRREDLSLIKALPPRRKIALVPGITAAVLSLPLFLAVAAASLPIWLPSVIILGRLEDKAWTHTIFYVLRLLLPLFWPFWWVCCMLLNFYDTLYKEIYQ